MRSLALLALLVLNTSIRAEDVEPTPVPEPPTMADVQTALKANDPATAAKHAAAITQANPQSGPAWFFLGYSLHAQGKLEEAIAAHEKAATFPKLAPVALYNLACAHALAGATEKAFQALQRARNAGFQPSLKSRTDPDLKSLRGDPRFDKLLPPAGANLPRGDAGQFNFWLGEWDATVRLLGANGVWTSAGKLSLRIGRVLGGHGVVEYTEGSIGAQETHGFSLRTFDPRENVWRLLLLWPKANRPTFSTLQGGFRHARGEFFAGGAGGSPVTRFTFSDTGDWRFRWDMATSPDRRAWTTTMQFLGTRRKDTAAGPADIAVRSPDNELCPGDEFRSFDFLKGSWGGLTGRSIMRGAAVVTESDDEFAIRAFHPGLKAWVQFVLRRGTPGFVRLQGSPDAMANATERVRWTERGADRLVRVRERRENGAWIVVKRDTFARRK